MKISRLNYTAELFMFQHQITHEFTEILPIFAPKLINKILKNS